MNVIQPDVLCLFQPNHKIGSASFCMKEKVCTAVGWCHFASCAPECEVCGGDASTRPRVSGGSGAETQWTLSW